MLARANMLAPKPSVRSYLGDSKPLYCKQISATRAAVHEMQLFKMQAQSASVCERFKVRIWRIS
jgi:hypothetical protein